MNGEWQRQHGLHHSFASERTRCWRKRPLLPPQLNFGAGAVWLPERLFEELAQLLTDPDRQNPADWQIHTVDARLLDRSDWIRLDWIGLDQP